MLAFSSNFVWGASTSSLQIEGGQRDGRSESIWDAFARGAGNVFDGHTAVDACRSYDRVEEDLDLLASLGVNAYRFSIAWPRVLPFGVGKANEAGLAYYDRVVDGLLARGIDPWVTLYHWDLPQCLADRGGWESRDVSDWFAEYTAAVVARLSDRVDRWMTLNEPSIFLGLGYADGTHAPGKRLPRREVLQATHHALLAHGKSCQAIRANAKLRPSVGWAPVGVAAIPASNRQEDIDAARSRTIGDASIETWPATNTWYADPVCFGSYPEAGVRAFAEDMPEIREGDMETIHQPLDFFGFNTYSGDIVRAGADGKPETVPAAPGTPITQFRWTVRPESLYWVSRFLSERYRLPLYVTENGLASMDWVHTDGKVHDPGRIDFMNRYIAALGRAIDDGADVRGYFHWSLLDNFEWAEGYRMRFGLVHVDFDSGERLPKESFHHYAEIARSNGAILDHDATPLRQ